MRVASVTLCLGLGFMLALSPLAAKADAPTASQELASLSQSTDTNDRQCYRWPLRQRAGKWAYDGDTVYISMPGLPAPLAAMSVRLIGLDTPEKGRRAKCEAEKLKAEKARQFLETHLREAETYAFCAPRWGKYAGRVLADLEVDGKSATRLLIDAGLARPYDGGKRQGWCD
ncbi:thermonuclease family protein [Rhodovibrionaceae bacterium A322]